jgi:hypothetical protein
VRMLVIGSPNELAGSHLGDQLTNAFGFAGGLFNSYVLVVNKKINKAFTNKDMLVFQRFSSLDILITS